MFPDILIKSLLNLYLEFNLTSNKYKNGII